MASERIGIILSKCHYLDTQDSMQSTGHGGTHITQPLPPRARGLLEETGAQTLTTFIGVQAISNF